MWWCLLLSSDCAQWVDHSRDGMGVQDGCIFAPAILGKMNPVVSAYNPDPEKPRHVVKVVGPRMIQSLDHKQCTESTSTVLST